MDERFSRIGLLLGTEGAAHLTQASVAVAGLGAVGSYAVEALARAGIGRLVLCDFDIIRPSNINRQLYALDNTLGMRKCDAARERVALINPRCRVEALPLFIDERSIAEVLSRNVDLVIDAIDSLNPKTDLIASVRQSGIPLISSMGAALRRDPACVRTGPLAQVRNCPLARVLRRRLRRRGIPLDFTCVYSTELITSSKSRHIENGSPEEQYYKRGRVRSTLGSLPTITGIFGLTAANIALEILAFPRKNGFL